LLRSGAILCRGADDVLEEWSAPHHFAEPSLPGYDPSEDDPSDEAGVYERVRELLSFTPTHRDELIRQSGASAAAVAAALLDLVLEGQAAEEEHGRYVLTASS
jgi:DNA processing protein